MSEIRLSENAFKLETTANPISPNVFCADPTGVVFGGRLYVYGTNDHQQYDAEGDNGKNSYEKIKSLVCFSTNDMANWEYHGIINTEEIAPWIVNSWAPSVVSRVEDDGVRFYLYFSNSGCGVGVITASHPLGPWSDPLKKPLIYQNMPGLENCPAPFDPGVCIDEKGVGWLSFGGGTAARGGEIYTKTPKLVKLGKDMLSFDSGFVSLNAPYFFEASELNYVDGTYIYSYSTDWQKRDKWNDMNIPAPNICSMGYMTSKTPLDGESWRFKGGFFLNAGDAGMEWCNNHTHFMEYKGEKYILHHTMHIQERMKTNGGFRCMCADYLTYGADNIPVAKPTRVGVRQIEYFDPYMPHSGAEMFTCADIIYERNGHGKVSAKSAAKGAWTYIKGVDFGKGVKGIRLDASGSGRIEIRLDERESVPVAEFELNGGAAKLLKEINGIHDMYIVFENKNTVLKEWYAE